ncbi:mannitol dehydrogenase family protein [Microbacterium oxydans]|uniref:mannitol dehydrogenase family protein n=1 Tax=Microbacterium oxydans TaxID=82380 RepID=UPI00226B5D27|nr:mannitol dehydrogenase family protein [Microbacterium oxydans]WAA66081.1 mannitol dehydrogenase family protein [Microbacterium oxydans]
MTGPARTQHPPVRAAHLGLGAFHRAHQAWYTQQANDRTRAEEGWGIAAFTGRTPAAAEVLSGSDGVYTLLERSAEGDRVETVQSIVRAVPGADERSWLDTIADPEVRVLTVTVTETAYSATSSVPGRIATALARRAAAEAGAIAVVSCDNLPRNGRMLRDVVLAAAGAEATSVSDIASFVDTVVDRITPAVTAEDIAVVRDITGYDDPAAVVTEPFSEWVLAGDFPGGAPDWAQAGARFVADVGPYEARKLYLLNAGHSFLAAAGRLRGYETIAEAFDDAVLRADTEALWAAQRTAVDLPSAELDDWLDALRIRFANPRIAHRLDQIRRDSPIKVALRLVAPLRRRQDADDAVDEAQRHAVETWIRSLLELDPTDSGTAAVARALSAVPATDRTRTVIDHLTPEGTLA